jgi:hypothetical protein
MGLGDVGRRLVDLARFYSRSPKRNRHVVPLVGAVLAAIIGGQPTRLAQTCSTPGTSSSPFRVTANAASERCVPPDFLPAQRERRVLRHRLEHS